MLSCFVAFSGSTGGRGGVDPLLEANETDVAGLQFPDRPEQFRQRASQPVEAGHEQAVAWPRMGDQPSQLRPFGRCAGDDVGEDAYCADLLQPVMLGCGVRVGGGEARVAEDVACPSNDGFADGFGNSIACLPGLPVLPKCRSPSVEGCVPPAVGIAPASFDVGIQQTRFMHSAPPCRQCRCIRE